MTVLCCAMTVLCCGCSVLWYGCSVLWYGCSVLCCGCSVPCYGCSMLCSARAVTVLCYAVTFLSCGCSVLCCAMAVLCCGCAVTALCCAMAVQFCALAVLCYAVAVLFCAVAVLITLRSLTLNSPQICTDHAPWSVEHTATSVGVILSSYNLFATLRQTLRHLKFPQRYCWCLKSSGMWLCLHHLVLKMKAFWTFETWNTAVRVTGRHLAENWTVQDMLPSGFNVWWRFISNSYQVLWGCYGRFGRKYCLYNLNNIYRFRRWRWHNPLRRCNTSKAG